MRKKREKKNKTKNVWSNLSFLKPWDPKLTWSDAIYMLDQPSSDWGGGGANAFSLATTVKISALNRI